MKHFWNFLLISCSFFLEACVSSSIDIVTTPPGADVYVSADGKPQQKMGQTPYRLDGTALSALSDSFVVSLQKPGFKSESIFVSSKTLPFRGSISSNMTEEFAGAGTLNLQTSMEEIARGVAQIQNLLHNKDYDSALNTASILLSKYPTVATLHGLEGNIHYLKKNLDKALVSYQRANKIAASAETERMINRIEELRGRLPSSIGGGF